MKIVPYSVELLKITEDADQHIELCGRVAHQSEAHGRTADFIKMLLDKGHVSVLEHASATFSIICDRGTSHEIVRHRVGCSYTQESTRYCRYGSEITVIQPFNIEDGINRWVESVKKAEYCYLSMLSTGMSPQMARSVLPICLKTQLVMTATFTAWRHFLKLRLAKAAHPHMRHVAGLIRDELMSRSVCFNDFQTEENDGGTT